MLVLLEKTSRVAKNLITQEVYCRFFLWNLGPVRLELTKAEAEGFTGPLSDRAIPGFDALKLT
jgi:hypothetical protein